MKDSRCCAPSSSCFLCVAPLMFTERTSSCSTYFLIHSTCCVSNKRIQRKRRSTRWEVRNAPSSDETWHPLREEEKHSNATNGMKETAVLFIFEFNISHLRTYGILLDRLPQTTRYQHVDQRTQNEQNETFLVHNWTNRQDTCTLCGIYTLNTLSFLLLLLDYICWASIFKKVFATINTKYPNGKQKTLQNDSFCRLTVHLRGWHISE